MKTTKKPHLTLLFVSLGFLISMLLLYVINLDQYNTWQKYRTKLATLMREYEEQKNKPSAGCGSQTPKTNP